MVYPMKFSIETVSKMTGIPAATLRNWEKRYGFPVPERNASGHREYSVRDVSFLKAAFRAQSEGHSLNQLSLDYHSRVLLPGQPGQWGENSFTSANDDCNYRVQLIYDSLLRFDAPSSAQQWMLLNAKLSPEQIFSLVFERLLDNLGQDWEAGRISIAQEHFISNYVRMRMGSYASMDFAATQECPVSLATLSEERHEGGLLLLSCHLKFRGYPISYFGVDLPIENLESALKESKSQVLGLSYVSGERILRDLPLLSRFEIPVVIGGKGVLALSGKDREALKQKKSQIFPCFEASGEKAADFFELVCHRRDHGSKRNEENSEAPSKFVP